VALEDSTLVTASAPTVGAQVDALEVISDVLSQGDQAEAGDRDAFYGRLCEAVCRLTLMERAVIFRYDADERRVRAAGAHGIALSAFEGMYLSVDSAPVARGALSEDRVIVATGERARDVPSPFAHLLDHALLVCTPMVAAGRWVGVILSERPEEAPLDQRECDLLWAIGKAAALAATARIATWHAERSRQLQQRIDLAREIHDGVVQRLFGVSLALSQETVSEEERLRCGEEVQRALSDLRSALQRPLGREARPTKSTLALEIDRLRHEHAGVEFVVEGDPSAVPEAFEPLAQSVLREAVRNACKHADPTRVDVRLHSNDGFALEVVNDGVRSTSGASWGMGLRLATLEALQLGGIVEFGPRGKRGWEVRLLVDRQRV
jgi:signal transduction histidine kinase